jgi:hypothetical protein
VDGGGYGLRHILEFTGETEENHEKIMIVVLLDEI